VSSNKSSFLLLGQDMHLKLLEFPCAYNIRSDELYDLSFEAFNFLRQCDGTKTLAELDPDVGFLADCLKEGVLELLKKPGWREIRVGQNEAPSLRYLMVEVTDRCNLRCRHCYLGDAGKNDLEWDTLRQVLDDFEDMGGLRLMVTGGEPLLYPHFELLNGRIEDRSFRSVLITNGTKLLDNVDFRKLNFQEIQFSLDGMELGHDHLRGSGTFRNVMQAMVMTQSAGIDVSVATVIHSQNLSELKELGELLSRLDVSAWTLEFPVSFGRMKENEGLMPDPETAAPFFDMEWGWGAHEPAEGYACGAHLACVDPGGRLIKCGYYRDITGGHVGGGLREAWLLLPKMKLEGACAECDVLADCGGGCRFRAELTTDVTGPDPVMCARMGRPLR
jgi:radical SAM protein with 4Fe4S-binding SPASM domain